MRNVHDIILEKIHTGEVHMISRWRFVLTSVFWIMGLVVALLLTVYLASFVLFVLHRSGLLLAPGFGWQGIIFFVVMSPWMLITATFVFLGTVYVLVRKYAFSYKKPTVYSLLSVVLCVLVLSLAIHMMAIHARIESFTQHHRVPGMSGMYRVMGNVHPEGMFMGRISAIDFEGLRIKTQQETHLLIRIAPETRTPPAYIPEIGEVIVVFGDEIAPGEVFARGIRVAPDDFMSRRDVFPLKPHTNADLDMAPAAP